MISPARVQIKKFIEILINIIMLKSNIFKQKNHTTVAKTGRF